MFNTIRFNTIFIAMTAFVLGFVSQGFAANKTLWPIDSDPSIENKELWKKIQQNPKSVTLTFPQKGGKPAQVVLSGDLKEGYYNLKSVTVIRNGISQKIVADFQLWSNVEVRAYLQWIDLNFDGQEDLRVFNNAGATGNDWYDTWLFDAQKKKFVFSQAFSDLSAVRVHAATKQITSFNRMGYCEESLHFYEPKGNGLKKVKSIYTQEEGCGTKEGCGCFMYTATLIKGKWQLSKGEEIHKSLYDLFHH